MGSFDANKYGLYDMGGNVWQWREDRYNSTKDSRVARGGPGTISSIAVMSSYSRPIADTSPGLIKSVAISPPPFANCARPKSPEERELFPSDPV